jgi:hypothetical protein
MNTEPFDGMLRSSGDGLAKIESFFRVAAGIDIERGDVARCSTFLRAKIDDLLTGAEVHARMRCHDRIESRDLQLSQSLQGCVSIFERIDEQIEMRTLLGYLASLPRAHLDTSTEAVENLSAVAGGLSVALACSLRIADPDLRKPRTVRWQRALQLVELLVLPATETRPALTSGERREMIAVNIPND